MSIPVYSKPALFRIGEQFRETHLGTSSVDACCQVLRGGESIGIFPEGTRNCSTTLLRGRRGLGFIVLRTGCPVVPAGIHFPASRRRARVPRIGRMEVRVGDPLTFNDLCAGAAPIIGHHRGRIEKHPGIALIAQQIVDRVMLSLSELSEKPYPRPAGGWMPPLASRSGQGAEAEPLVSARCVADSGRSQV